jgi:nucleotide-sensitive chloride channel 1A
MPPTTIHTVPSLDSFTALADHQSQTPTSFFAEKPILHYHAIGARVLASRDQISKLPVFADGPAPENAGSEVGTAVETVDVFVSSE